MATPEFLLGDQVVGKTKAGEMTVSGTVVILDLSPRNPRLAVVDGAQRMFDLDPATVRYQVDPQGFWYRRDPATATVTIGRNDDRLMDTRWLKRQGAVLLNQSLNPRKRSRRT